MGDPPTYLTKQTLPSTNQERLGATKESLKSDPWGSDSRKGDGIDLPKYPPIFCFCFELLKTSFQGRLGWGMVDWKQVFPLEEMRKNVGFWLDYSTFFDVAWEFFLLQARVDLHKAVNIQ